MARNLNKLEAIFPICYIYGWLGTYYKTHLEQTHHWHSLPKMVKTSGGKMNRTPNVLKARELLKCKGPLVVYSNALTKDTLMNLIDNHNLSPSWRTYLICLHYGFLTLRHGRTTVIEPYFPHKFGRQFGFNQDVFDEARMNVREGTLQDVARY